MNVSDLEDVNHDVNQLPYAADPARYALPEFWTIADEHGGDCEDFALAKLRRLHARGWPIERLRLAVCYTELAKDQPDHAVLAVDIADGTQRVLDNRVAYVQSIDELSRVGYRPHSIQQVGGSRKWVQWLWTAA